MLVYYGSMGWDTNNSVELVGLWQGMQLHQLHNFFPIEIEGNSQIIINMISKILSGSPPSRVADIWRLMERLELIVEWLQENRAIYLKHTRRSGNKVVDLLAKKGVTNAQTLFAGPLSSVNDRKLLQECTQMVHQENFTPDAGGH